VTGMFTTILSIIDSVLNIVELKIERKYVDQLVEIKRAYNEETNKPEADRSDAVLDNLWVELRIVTEAIASSLRK
jgi:hypothetical protein